MKGEKIPEERSHNIYYCNNGFRNQDVHIEMDGIRIACTTFGHVLKEMEQVIENSCSVNYISITNTESMYHAKLLPDHLEYINNSTFSLCDGIGSVIAGLAWGHKIPRLNGPILMLKACEHGVNKGWRHFFYGGNEGVADLMAEKLTQKYPGLNVVGTYCPPFRQLTPEDDIEVINIINKSQADIVWVGLGLLKQEKWIADHLTKIQVPWMSGVGAAFDYHAGTVPWAPKWIQAIGMEWVYRTILQPRLRIKRYYWSFVFLIQSVWRRLLRINQKRMGKYQ